MHQQSVTPIVPQLKCRQTCFGLHKIAGCLHRDIPYVTIVCDVHTSLGTLQYAPHQTIQFLIRDIHSSHSDSLLCLIMLISWAIDTAVWIIVYSRLPFSYMYDRWRKLTGRNVLYVVIQTAMSYWYLRTFWYTSTMLVVFAVVRGSSLTNVHYAPSDVSCLKCSPRRHGELSYAQPHQRPEDNSSFVGRHSEANMTFY